MGSAPGTAQKHQFHRFRFGTTHELYHNTFDELLHVDNSMFLKHFHVFPDNKIYKKEPRQ